MNVAIQYAGLWIDDSFCVQPEILKKNRCARGCCARICQKNEGQRSAIRWASSPRSFRKARRWRMAWSENPKSRGNFIKKICARHLRELYAVPSRGWRNCARQSVRAAMIENSSERSYERSPYQRLQKEKRKRSECGVFLMLESEKSMKMNIWVQCLYQPERERHCRANDGQQKEKMMYAVGHVAIAKWVAGPGSELAGFSFL